jgi:serine/threonine protein kinase
LPISSSEEPEFEFVWLLHDLSVVHLPRFFHRDVKRENFLSSDDGLRIVDFGLARDIRSRPPYMQYACTGWYKVPEVLLKPAMYNSPVDIWAVGAIVEELYVLRPLFQGTSEAGVIGRRPPLVGPRAPNWRHTRD